MSLSASLPKNSRQLIVLLSAWTSCWKKGRRQRRQVDADDAKDSKIEPLVPMFGGEIAVHPQLIGADPVMPVDGAGALVVLCDCLWLGNLDNDLVWQRLA